MVYTYNYKHFLLFLIKVLLIKLTTCQDDEDNSIHYKKARNDDFTFFDIEQKDITGKWIDFDNFSGGLTIVAFNIGKKGQTCGDVEHLVKEFGSIHKLFPYGVEFVLVPDARADLKSKCPDVVKKILSDKGVNYVLTEPVGDDSHPLYDYMADLYAEKKIGDKMYFIVTPEGDLEMHYNLPSPGPLKKELKRIFRHIMNPKPGWQEF